MSVSSKQLLVEGTWLFVRDNWIAWKAVREGQGVVPGSQALPRKSHPHIDREFEELELKWLLWLYGLALSRLALFRSLSAEEFDTLLSVGRGETELRSDFQERIAKDFHEGWWRWRQANFQSGHVGDKAWEEETEAEQENDLALVSVFAAVLAQYERCSSGSPEQALICYLRDED